MRKVSLSVSGKRNKKRKKKYRNRYRNKNLTQIVGSLLTRFISFVSSDRLKKTNFGLLPGLC